MFLTLIILDLRIHFHIRINSKTYRLFLLTDAYYKQLFFSAVNLICVNEWGGNMYIFDGFLLELFLPAYIVLFVINKRFLQFLSRNGATLL